MREFLLEALLALVKGRHWVLAIYGCTFDPTLVYRVAGPR
jgi:hypothetical protein